MMENAMPEKKVYVTKAGLEKLTSELQELKTVKRKEISDRIQDAKELGDLSENAEYAEAKEEQSFTEGRILDLENSIKNAVLIEEGASDIVVVGSTVDVESDGIARTYFIVGSSEADPAQGLISNESPLGEAFLGKRVGEGVEIEVPKGTLAFRITKIS
jgi:transcription elongation factor GreA